MVQEKQVVQHTGNSDLDAPAKHLKEKFFI